METPRPATLELGPNLGSLPLVAQPTALSNRVAPSGNVAGAPGQRSQVVTVIVPAAQYNINGLVAPSTFPIPASGTMFQLLQASAPLNLRYDQTSGFSTYYPGSGLTLNPATSFTQLELQNVFPFPVTAILLFGWDISLNYTNPAMPATILELTTNIPVTAGVYSYAAVASNIYANGVLSLSSGASNAPGNIYFRNGYFWGFKPGSIGFTGLAPTNNTNTVNIGLTRLVQPSIINPGQFVNYQAPVGESINLGQISFFGTSGSSDGIYAMLTL